MEAYGRLFWYCRKGASHILHYFLCMSENLWHRIYPQYQGGIIGAPFSIYLGQFIHKNMLLYHHANLVVGDENIIY